MWRSEGSSDAHSWREGWRGKGRGRGGSFLGRSGRPTWERNQKPSPAYTPSPEPPLGALLFSLSKSNFDQDAKDFESQSTITGCRTVTSYNWLDSAKPTIVIPGKPPKWTPLSEPRQLKPDEGQYFRDPNAARYANHPIEPAIIAALTMETNISRKVDIVACGSTLGNLLRFIRGDDKKFRMLVELVDDSVFFVRRENSPRELIPDVKGYGHSFPESYTTWDAEVRGSASHQRVISYRFGGLEFLVRFEGDGYVADGDDKKGIRELSAVPGLGANEAVGELADELGRSRFTTAIPGAGDEALKIIYAGDLVKQDCIFELKTRSVKRKEMDTFEDTFGDQLPRLWVSQIPKFILAYHNRGVFEEPSVMDAKDDVKTWEKEHVDILSRLAALIHHIIGLVRSRPDSKIELRHDAVGILEVREQLADVGDALSDPVRVLWGEGKHSDDGSLDDDSFSEGDRPDPDESDAVGWDYGSEDDGPEPDYTACSSEDCGYCGRCSY